MPFTIYSFLFRFPSWMRTVKKQSNCLNVKFEQLFRKIMAINVAVKESAKLNYLFDDIADIMKMDIIFGNVSIEEDTGIGIRFS